jgi:serine protease
MASPHVAGVAALMKAANPALTATELRTRLIAVANTRAGVSLPNSGRILDAFAAVAAAGGAPPTIPVLVATPAFLDLGATGTTATVRIDNRGAGNVTYLRTTPPPVAWLSGVESDVDPANTVVNDLITFTVDRTGLPNDVYQTTRTLEYTENGTANVRTVDVVVRMQVGASTVVNDTIFVLLIDPDTLESRFQTETLAGSNFNFSFSAIPAGDYLLVAGTDRDNDDLLGDPGELFGAWPDLDDPKRVTVRGGVNSSQLDFGMQDLVQVTSTGSELSLRSFRRLR